jgi:hypothetical protein
MKLVQLVLSQNLRNSLSKNEGPKNIFKQVEDGARKGEINKILAITKEYI